MKQALATGVALALAPFLIAWVERTANRINARLTRNMKDDSKLKRLLLWDSVDFWDRVLKKEKPTDSSQH